jgi:hypothetical protein
MEPPESWPQRYCIWTANRTSPPSPCAPARRCTMLTSDSIQIPYSSMHRVVARFLLLTALAGNLIPLALAATIAPRHACCVRKAVHPCHGSTASGSEQLVVTNSGCCQQDSGRALATSHNACPSPQGWTRVAPTECRRSVDAQSETPAAARRTLQSTRAPPQISIA